MHLYPFVLYTFILTWMMTANWPILPSEASVLLGRNEMWKQGRKRVPGRHHQHRKPRNLTLCLLRNPVESQSFTDSLKIPLTGYNTRPSVNVHFVGREATYSGPPKKMYICSWEPFYTSIGNIVPTLFIYFNCEPVFFRHPNYYKYRRGLLLQSTKPNQQFTIRWYVDIPSQHWHTRHSGQMSSRPHTTKKPKWWFSEEHASISGEPKLVKCEFIWSEYIHTLMAYWSTFGPFWKILPLLKRTRSLGNFRPSFMGILMGFSGMAMKEGPLVVLSYMRDSPP